MSAGREHAVDVPLTERTGFLANKVGLLLLHAVEARLARLGLTSRTYFVLAAVDRDKPSSQQDLSRLLGIDPTTIVALVDQLEQGGFVVRARNPSDRRRYDLHLTPSGATALASAHEAMVAAESEFFAPLTADELRAYHSFLRRLLRDRWPPRQT